MALSNFINLCLHTMKNTIFTGSAIAIITPMNADGTVNFDRFGELLDFQINNKTDAVVVCGTTGECATLSHEEHCAAIEYAVKHVNHRVPVIAGTGSNDTMYALKLSLEAERLGADALLMVTPYYNKTSQEGIIRHYTYIADRVNTPIIVYNVPGRTGFNIKPETYAVLAKHKNIVGIKEANGDLSSIAKTLSLCGDDIDLYSGNDDQIVATMSLGGKGVISVLAHCVPAETHDMCKAALDGDYKKAAELQLKYIRLSDALFSDVSPIPAKAALKLMGMDCGECRMPLGPMNKDAYANLVKTMKEYGLSK